MKKIKNSWKSLSTKKKIALSLITLLLVAAIATLVVFLCAGKGESVKNIIKKKNDKKEEPKITIVDPDSNKRPYAVMINNIGTARPYQSGLQDAYIIYEFIVEGGITRYLALFKDVNVDRIGTVRSSRHYYLDYVLENDAIYAHWGGSEFAYSDISKLDIDNIDGMNGVYFWKDSSLPVSTEHTAYTKTSSLDEAVEKKGYRKELNDHGLLLNYSAKPVDLSKDETVKDANTVDIRYSNVIESDKYEYDADNKVYKRSVNGDAHVDYVTKKQYTFKNIITYQVENNTIPGDYKGRQNLENIGSGEGYYITEGKAIEITWEKKSRKDKTVYKVKSTGKELVVNDGNTFIQVQPKGQPITIS